MGGGCVSWLLILAGGVLGLVTLLRWFEQATEAVENRWWNKVIMLVVIPPSVWFYPSRISAGRPSAVPRHEPVRGFGKVSLNPHEGRREAEAKTEAMPTASLAQGDGPPPGTP